MMLSNGKVVKMPDKLTDNEIIKALECCGQNILFEHCVDCPFDDLSKAICTIRLSRVALNLINRLQAENSNLQAENSNLQEKNSNLTSDLTSLQNDLISAKAENKRLKKGWKADVILTANIKAEAYKEFADRVKLEFYYEFDELIPSIMADKIDNLLKELVGADND